MAISLKDIQKNNFDRPPRIVIHGTPGIGKTTFAAGAPNPIFIQTEDGLGNLSPDAFPLAKSFSDVMEAFGALYSDNHGYETVVVDSLSALEQMIWSRVAKDAGHDNIEQLGYGKGYTIALDHWHSFLDGVNALRDKGIMPVLIAHTDVVRCRYPARRHKRACCLHPITICHHLVDRQPEVYSAIAKKTPFHVDRTCRQIQRSLHTCYQLMMSRLYCSTLRFHQ